MNYREGDFFVVRTNGFIGWLIRVGTRSHYNHAGVIIDASGATVEAKPWGAVRGNIANYAGHPQKVGHPLNPDTATRVLLVQNAVSLIGRGYGFLDIFSLALLQFGIHWKWIHKIVSTDKNLICSQVVALDNQMSGLILFKDGRDPQDVTPEDLAELLP